MRLTLKHCLILCLSLIGYSSFALEALDDNELGQVDGAGLALVLEDFIFDSNLANGATLEFGNIAGSRKNGAAAPVTGEAQLQVSRFYIAGSGSNKGQANLTGVNIGTLDAPYSVAVLDGDNYRVNNKALLQISAPERNADSVLSFYNGVRTGARFPGKPAPTGTRITGVNAGALNFSALNGGLSDWADVGIVYDLNIAGSSAQALKAYATGLNVDGSKLQLWGNNNEVLGNLSFKGYAKSLEFQACNAGGVTGCGQPVVFNDVIIEQELGYGDDQPLKLSVLPDGNFELTLGSIEGRSNTFYQNYYANGPKSNIYVGELKVGNDSFGSSTIANLQIQYLHVRSRDL